MLLLKSHIRKTFGVDYHMYSMWEMIRGLGFRCVVPRTKDYRVASLEEAETFKKAHRRMAY